MCEVWDLDISDIKYSTVIKRAAINYCDLVDMRDIANTGILRDARQIAQRQLTSVSAIIDNSPHLSRRELCVYLTAVIIAYGIDYVKDELDFHLKNRHIYTQYLLCMYFNLLASNYTGSPYIIPHMSRESGFKRGSSNPYINTRWLHTIFPIGTTRYRAMVMLLLVHYHKKIQTLNQLVDELTALSKHTNRYDSDVVNIMIKDITENLASVYAEGPFMDSEMLRFIDEGNNAPALYLIEDKVETDMDLYKMTKNRLFITLMIILSLGLYLILDMIKSHRLNWNHSHAIGINHTLAFERFMIEIGGGECSLTYKEMRIILETVATSLRTTETLPRTHRINMLRKQCQLIETLIDNPGWNYKQRSFGEFLTLISEAENVSEEQYDVWFELTSVLAKLDIMLPDIKVSQWVIQLAMYFVSIKLLGDKVTVVRKGYIAEDLDIWMKR